MEINQLQEILERDNCLYIKNTSDNGGQRKLMGLAITYPTREGNKSHIIPASSVPYDICGVLGANNVMESSTFRSMFNKGVISFVPKGDAMSILRDPYMKESWNEANAQVNNTATARTDEHKLHRDSFSNENSDTSIDLLAQLKVAESPEEKKAILELLALERSSSSEAPTKTNAKLETLNKLVSAKAIGGKKIINELVGLLGQLSEEDLTNISVNTEYTEEARNWAMDRLVYMQSSDDAVTQ